MCFNLAASGLFITSMLSSLSCTFKQTANLLLLRIWSFTIPAGFWVANIKWTPKLRPILETLINSSIKSSCCCFNSANSSQIINKCGIGSSTIPSWYNFWYLYISIVPSAVFSLAWLNLTCLLLNSLCIDAKDLCNPTVSILVIVPTMCGNFTFPFWKAPAKPPPL